MINKKNMIKKWILAITVASMTMNAAIFTVPAKTSSNVAAKSKTTPEKKGETTGTWYGNIFGIAVVLDIKNDGTYDIKFEDKNKETGVWCLNGDNIVTDKDSDAETTYTFNGSSLITKINGETLKLTKNRTNAVKKVSSTSNKNVDEEDFNGVWKANKVEIGKLSAKPDTFGITNAFLKIKDKKADIFVNSTALSKSTETNLEGTLKDDTLKFTAEKDNKTFTASVYALEDGTLMCILKVDNYEMKLYLEKSTEEEMAKAKGNNASVTENDNSDSTSTTKTKDIKSGTVGAVVHSN